MFATVSTKLKLISIKLIKKNTTVIIINKMNNNNSYNSKSSTTPHSIIWCYNIYLPAKKLHVILIDPCNNNKQTARGHRRREKGSKRQVNDVSE